jgi:hypothetical protein
MRRIQGLSPAAAGISATSHVREMGLVRGGGMGTGMVFVGGGGVGEGGRSFGGFRLEAPLKSLV